MILLGYKWDEIKELIIILLNFGSGVILFFEAVEAVGSMAMAEGLDVVLEGPLVLEIRAADAKPKLATVLLVSSPIPPHCEGLAAFPAHEGLDAMLPLVMRLEGSEIFQWLGSRVVDVVSAAWGAAVAGKPKHAGGLSPAKRFWPSSVL